MWKSRAEVSCVGNHKTISRSTAPTCGHFLNNTHFQIWQTLHSNEILRLSSHAFWPKQKVKIMIFFKNLQRLHTQSATSSSIYSKICNQFTPAIWYMSNKNWIFNKITCWIELHFNISNWLNREKWALHIRDYILGVDLRRQRKAGQQHKFPCLLLYYSFSWLLSSPGNPWFSLSVIWRFFFI